MYREPPTIFFQSGKDEKFSKEIYPYLGELAVVWFKKGTRRIDNSPLLIIGKTEISGAEEIKSHLRMLYGGK